VALAQAFEEQFVAHFSSSASGAQPSGVAVADIRTLEPSISREEIISATPASEQPQENSSDPPMNGSEGVQQNQTSSHSALNAGEGANEQIPTAGHDVQMHDEQTGAGVNNVGTAGQNGNARGAAIGENLQGLEMDVGSADGRSVSGSTAVSDIVGETTRQVGVQNRDVQAMDVVLDSSAEPVQNNRNIESGSAEHAEERNESSQEEHTDMPLNSIDPTFLEALPEDLRAEVLASQQTPSTSAVDQQPPSVQDIDPEFLAALPPEIQAEVLAQQQAQRIIQAHNLEGQPVDMDSASIIATFPAELREEV
jgi:E3 ubiquitin-protein ligase HUWE1